MSPHEPKPEPRFGLSVSQLVASALAAASAAFGASYLGVGGTIIGAAVASVIATLASAMYTSSLERTRTVVHSTVTQWSRTAAHAPVVDPGAPAAPDDTRELTIAPEPPRPRRPLPWVRLTVAAAAVLATTLGVLTGIEGILGKPISTVVGGSDATGTSLGAVDGSAGSHTKKAPPTKTTPPAPSTPTTGATPTPTATPTSEPSGSPTSPPTSTPTPVPDPSGTPTGG